jgi:hypothetical protein
LLHFGQTFSFFICLCYERGPSPLAAAGAVFRQASGRQCGETLDDIIDFVKHIHLFMESKIDNKNKK